MAFAETFEHGSPGVSERSVEFVDAIQHGLPVTAAQDIALHLAPGDPNFRYQIVPKATLARRKHSARLSPEEGERVVRLGRLWDRTLSIWKDADAARRFLWRPNALLSMRTPISVALAGESGGRMVETLLGQFEAGVAI